MSDVIILEPNLRNALGHQLIYSANLCESLKSLGYRCEIWGASDYQGSGCQDIRRVFAGSRNWSLKIRGLARFLHPIWSNLVVFFSLVRGGRPSDFLFYMSPRYDLLLGIAVWIALTPRTSVCQIFLNFNHPEEANLPWIHRKVLQIATRILQACCVVRIGSDSVFICRELEKRYRTEVRLLPIPITWRPRGKGKSREQTIILVPGEPRDEKGFPFACQLVEYFLQLELPNVHFIVQSNLSGKISQENCIEPYDRLKKLKRSNLTLVDSHVSETEYFDLLERAHLALLPYDPQCYIGRTSQILIECMYARCQVITSDQTWMASQIQEHNLPAEVCPYGHLQEWIRSIQVFLTREWTFPLQQERVDRYLEFHSSANLAQIVVS